MSMDANDRVGATRRASILMRMEAFYLQALRLSLLLLATVMLVAVAWFGVAGLYRLTRDAASVKPAMVTVTAEEVADLPAAAAGRAKPRSDPAAEARAYYKGFVDRYYALYARGFAPFRQSDDPALTRAAFDERFVGTDQRMAQIGEGLLEFAENKSELEQLLSTMTQVADLPRTAERLRAYKAASKRLVKRTVRGTRTERYCSYYGYYINACIDYSTREVPYSRQVTEMVLPKGVTAPPELFGAYQNRALELTQSRRREAEEKAEAQKAEILADNARGSANIWLAIQIVGGFLALMFLFLLIAIERHQRVLATRAAGPGASDV